MNVQYIFVWNGGDEGRANFLNVKDGNIPPMGMAAPFIHPLRPYEHFFSDVSDQQIVMWEGENQDQCWGGRKEGRN